VEHRPLTDQEIIERCCLNMTETYFSIAQSAVGAKRYVDDGVMGWFSELDHPATNVAVIARATPKSLLELRRQKDIHGPFTSYILPTNDDSAVLEMATRAGFSVGSRLNLMFLKPRPQKAAPELEFLKDSSDRFDLTYFLARQFFFEMDDEFSTMIAGLTAKTTKCELIRFRRGPSLEAGAMVSQVRDTLGFYNIAVAPDRRHRGVGGTVLSHLIGLAGARDCYAVLQCGDTLVEWYERIGFRRYGSVVMIRA
jgi:GNAT superfamily N-acetyltransferase